MTHRGRSSQSRPPVAARLFHGHADRKGIWWPVSRSPGLAPDELPPDGALRRQVAGQIPPLAAGAEVLVGVGSRLRLLPKVLDCEPARQLGEVLPPVDSHRLREPQAGQHVPQEV